MVPDSKSARSFASSSPWLPEAAQLCAAAAARHERALSMTSSAQRTSDRTYISSHRTASTSACSSSSRKLQVPTSSLPNVSPPAYDPQHSPLTVHPVRITGAETTYLMPTLSALSRMRCRRARAERGHRAVAKRGQSGGQVWAARGPSVRCAARAWAKRVPSRPSVGAWTERGQSVAPRPERCRWRVWQWAMCGQSVDRACAERVPSACRF